MIRHSIPVLLGSKDVVSHPNLSLVRQWKGGKPKSVLGGLVSLPLLKEPGWPGGTGAGDTQ